MKFSLIISTLLSFATSKKIEKESDSTPDPDGLHPYVNGMNPGMALRLEQQTVFAL